MRNNQPVTQINHPVAPGVMIISRTDSAGIITHVNDDFVAVSGFERDELIGQPQNIVRHPDMPEEAFRDLWATVKSGRPWVAVVKNRRKNGDHYWVKATVTPAADGGYMSVRVRATEEEIAAAEQLFAELRADKTLRLECGQREARASVRLFRRFMDINLTTRLWLATFASMFAIAFVLGLGWRVNAAALDLLTHVDAATKMAYAENIRRTHWLFVIASVGVAILWPLVAWIIVRGFKLRVAAAIDAARSIAALDLRKPISSAGKDEMGFLLAQLAIMRNHLQENAVLLKQMTERLGSMSERMNESSRHAAEMAEEQASVTASMAASIEELSVSIDHVGEFAGEAERMSQQSGVASEEGGRIIISAASEMEQIAGAVENSSSVILDLESHSAEISSIAAVIKDIADQTNLLALNAAIEAARAGEHGRGFAVVADEVRKLSEKTSRSTADISAMIDKVQSGSRAAGEEMKTSILKVHAGVDLARQSGKSISEIQAASQHVVDAVREINLALQEQGVAARDIAGNVERVAQMTERNSAMSQESARIAEAVQHAAGDVKRLADAFRL